MQALILGAPIFPPSFPMSKHRLSLDASNQHQERYMGDDGELKNPQGFLAQPLVS